MMSPDSNDLSPRLSIKDVGDSLSSPSFDRDMNASTNGSMILTSSDLATPIGTHESHTTTTVLAIREEDLVLLSSTLEQALDSADQTLQGLEADRRLLPSAILRKCHEFADGLGSLAEELENQSSEERTKLVEAIRDDLRLFEEEADLRSLSVQTIERRHNETEDAIVRALSGASTLLRDVEAAFREIGNDEAEEIADAALIMARLFLLSLQNIHSNISGQLASSDSQTNKRKDSAVWIEELGDENETDNKASSPTDPESKPHERRNNHRRMRVLWPPLGPKVDGAMVWTKEEATKRPFLAVALGLTLWPVAISTALLGTSLFLIDGALQDTYERFQDTPWITVAEESAAQAYHTGRLAVATGKLVGKQSIRVTSRQIERRGGIQPIIQDLGGMALDRIKHPIDTIGKIWDGVHWGFGVAKDVTEDFLRMRRESQDSLI